jgi:hypothetical protein
MEAPPTDVCADPKRVTLISKFRGVFAIAAIFFLVSLGRDVHKRYEQIPELRCQGCQGRARLPWMSLIGS